VGSLATLVIGDRQSLPMNPIFRKVYAPPRFSGGLPRRTAAVFLGIISPAISESSVTMKAPIHVRRVPIRFSQIHCLGWEKSKIVANTALKIATNEPNLSFKGPKKMIEGISLK
jgi:hypothetical protein